MTQTNEVEVPVTDSNGIRYASLVDCFLEKPERSLRNDQVRAMRRRGDAEEDIDRWIAQYDRPERRNVYKPTREIWNF